MAKGKDALSKGAHVPLAELSKWAQAARQPRTQFLPVLTPRWENGAGGSAEGLRQPENLSINRQPKMQNKILHIRATLRLDGAQNQRARVSHTHTLTALTPPDNSDQGGSGKRKKGEILPELP